MTPQEHILEDFFDNWVFRHKVVATVEGGLKFEEAQRAWKIVLAAHMRDLTQIVELEQGLKYHKAKHQEWLAAYQSVRCKHVGDYTRMFVRRPRMRPLIRFLLSA